MGGDGIRIQLPASWPGKCSQSFHKAAEARSEISQGERSSLCYLSGRHIADGTVQQSTSTAHIDSVALESGISCQFLQVPSDSCTATGVLGILGGLSQEGAQITEGENPEDKIRSLLDTERRAYVSKRVG